MAGLVPAVHDFAVACKTLQWLGRQDVDARDIGERSDAVLRTAMRGHDESERRRKQQKSPAENRGAFDLEIVKEDVPSLADLAATYSSKP